MRKADLHMHSSFSDGVLEPLQLAENARSQGMELIALTDHDTFVGSDLLRAADRSVPCITGIELSIKDMHGLHLLAYGKTEGKSLRARVSLLAQARRDRARKMLGKLEALGMPLDWNQLLDSSRDAIGRPHIARALVSAGYVSSMQEAFERFIGHDAPAYVAGERMTMQEALLLVRENGFVPVLAHPYELRQEEQTIAALVRKWKDQGLMGIEVYHPSAISHGMYFLETLAQKEALLVTGGSDFHQQNDKHGKIGCMCQYWTNAAEDINRLIEAL